LVPGSSPGGRTSKKPLSDELRGFFFAFKSALQAYAGMEYTYFVKITKLDRSKMVQNNVSLFIWIKSK
jgi:hypothetical protein